MADAEKIGEEEKVEVDETTSSGTAGEPDQAECDSKAEEKPDNSTEENNSNNAVETESKEMVILPESQEKLAETTEPSTVEVEVSVDPEVIDKLTTGTLGLFLPNLQKAKGSLNEVLHNQEVLIETIQQENAKFTDSMEMAQLKATMEQAKFYHSKLINLKRDMTSLMDKSTKLKRRAVKLQQQKQKEELTRGAQRERELERERMLKPEIAKKEPPT